MRQVKNDVARYAFALGSSVSLVRSCADLDRVMLESVFGELCLCGLWVWGGERR